MIHESKYLKLIIADVRIPERVRELARVKLEELSK